MKSRRTRRRRSRSGASPDLLYPILCMRLPASSGRGGRQVSLRSLCPKQKNPRRWHSAGQMGKALRKVAGELLHFSKTERMRRGHFCPNRYSLHQNPSFLVGNTRFGPVAIPRAGQARRRDGLRSTGGRRGNTATRRRACHPWTRSAGCVRRTHATATPTACGVVTNSRPELD